MIKQKARQFSRLFLLFLAGSIIVWAGIGALKVLQIIPEARGADYGTEVVQRIFGLVLLVTLAVGALVGFTGWVTWAFESNEAVRK